MYKGTIPSLTPIIIPQTNLANKATYQLLPRKRIEISIPIISINIIDLLSPIFLNKN